MKEKKVGIVSSPELPSTIAHKIQKQFEQDLSRFVADGRHKWKVELVVDLLTGAIEDPDKIMKETAQYKKTHDWDFALSLTDLPIYDGKHIILADANIAMCTGQISLPAFGLRPTPNQVKKIMLYMVKELYFRQANRYDRTDLEPKGIGPYDPMKRRGLVNKVKNVFHFSSIRRVESSEADDPFVRFIITPKMNGWIKTLFGMTISNRPWTILPSLKNVVAIAFATGAYGLIFPTLWKLSVSYNIYRFFGLMAAAIAGMVVWIIFAHDLWEKNNEENKNRLRWMYNLTTVLTLGMSVMMYYTVLYILFLAAVSVYVPPELYEAEAGQKVGPLNYLKLAWLAASVATFAGAIGAGLENAENVRKSTYSYRQYHRYQKMKEQEEEEKKEKKVNDESQSGC